MTVGSGRKRLLIALAFLLPNLLGFLVFTAGPVAGSLWMSLTDLSLTEHNRFSEEPVRFVGLQNYEQILFGAESQQFWPYFGNTVYLMIGIPLGIAGSLALSLLLTAKIGPQKGGSKAVAGVWVCVLTVVAAGSMWALTTPGPMPADGGAMSIESGLTDLSSWEVQRLRSVAATLAMVGAGVLALLGVVLGTVFFRTVFYLPSLLAGVPMFLLWKTLYRPQGGLINAVVDPAIDAVHGVVMAVPSWLVQGLAGLMGVWVLGVVVMSVAKGIEKLRYREAGFGSLLGRVLLLVTFVAVFAGVIWVLWGLPEAARVAAAASDDGFTPPEWLVSTTWAKPALILMGVWLGVGGANMLLYIAGISNIPPELYEAADIDGATSWQRFVHVTWPQLAPTTFFIVIMSTIGGLQGGFEQALIMTGGLYDTTVLTYYIYNLAFTDTFDLGKASAVAWVMFAIIFTMTVVNYRFGSRLTNE